MQKHIKNYLEANGYDAGDWIACEVCGSTAVDIHHLAGRPSRGGTDEASCLIALCRSCHTKAHNKREFNDRLKAKKGCAL